MAYSVEEKQHILSQGLRNGVSSTCNQFKISRTTYYNWMKNLKKMVSKD